MISFSCVIRPGVIIGRLRPPSPCAHHAHVPSRHTRCSSSVHLVFFSRSIRLLRSCLVSRHASLSRPRCLFPVDSIDHLIVSLSLSAVFPGSDICLNHPLVTLCLPAHFPSLSPSTRVLRARNDISPRRDTISHHGCWLYNQCIIISRLYI